MFSPTEYSTKRFNRRAAAWPQFTCNFTIISLVPDRHESATSPPVAASHAGKVRGWSNKYKPSPPKGKCERFFEKAPSKCEADWVGPFADHAQNVVALPIHFERGANSRADQRQSITGHVQLPPAGLQDPFAQKCWCVRFQEEVRKFDTAASKSKWYVNCMSRNARASITKFESRMRRILSRRSNPPLIQPLEAAQIGRRARIQDRQTVCAHRRKLRGGGRLLLRGQALTLHIRQRFHRVGRVWRTTRNARRGEG